MQREDKYYTRKPHRKSRTGCKQCRLRRIKCDERKPSCSSCVRHSTVCSLLPSASTTKIPQLKWVSRNTSQLPKIPWGLIGSLRNDSLIDSDTLSSEQHMKDLELLHHYTISTSLTLTRGRKDHEEIWNITVPQLALYHPFLLHGVLAISALHLAYLRPERQQEYTVIAANHESIALPFFRANTSYISEKNCSAVFAFSGLVIVYAMASPQPERGLLFADSRGAEGVPEWLQLLRGTYALLSSFRHLVTTGPMAPLLNPVPGRGVGAVNPDDAQLTALLPLFPLSGSSSSERRGEIHVYLAALESLRESFWIPYSADRTFDMESAPFLWPVRVPPGFIKLLSERQPEALILPAHQCVLLKRVGPCWFMDGHVRRLMAIIHEDLDEKWRHWIAWPLEQVAIEQEE